ncbi:MAG: glycoside hydrolase family 3 C-terminal domain-containing protein [Christensenellales bacterium]|nr:glycoside hydrolase family 3 C-terminal domain-containing protein [Christensenellales bacterium]
MAKKNRPKKSKALVVWAIVTVIVLLADCVGNYLVVGLPGNMNSLLDKPMAAIGEAIDFKLSAGELGGLMDTLFGSQRPIYSDEVTSVYPTQKATNKAEAFANAQEVNLKLAEEGFVLLKNENAALPMNKGARISVFSKNSVNLSYGGSGSGGFDTSNNKNLYESLNDAGFVTNPTLKRFYESSQSGSVRTANSSDLDNGDNQKIATAETPQSKYTDAVKNSYADYSDAALVVITRIGGEGFDLPRYQGDSEGAVSVDSHYLELDQNEIDLLTAVTDGTFKRVVVVFNTPSSFEATFLKDSAYAAFADKIDAAVWIGFTGSNGITALGEILNGDVNPSGRLVDTWAADFTKNPSFVNFGTGCLPDTTDKYDGGMYYSVDYEEGIYVGYRYYETRGETDGEDWYNANVVYPFGYGLSYTTFDWTVGDASASEIELGTTITVPVTVKNTGSVAGKEVVQLYASAPYTLGGIEKAHKVLVGFAKTKLLQPGESETVTVSFDPYSAASYDYRDANSNGFSGYELGAGEYTLYVSRNAHESEKAIALNLAADVQIGTDPTTDSEVVNRYTDSEDFLDSDWQLDAMLSRADWEGTWPTPQTAQQHAGTDRLYEEIRSEEHNNPTDFDSEEYPWFGEEPTLTLRDLLPSAEAEGYEPVVSYDDERWEELMMGCDEEEMIALINNGAYHTLAMESVGLPATIHGDGPSGFTCFMSKEQVNGTCQYVSEPVMASTWNINLMNELGEAIGEEGTIGDKATGQPYSSIYAPGVNIHRSPFGGRCSEYFSEDPFISGMMGAAEVQGIQSRGVLPTVKHFVANEQETHRSIGGDLSWLSEQALREIYLKPFEYTVKLGETRGIMTSFNRIGTRWTGGDYRLLTEILRNEWGFNGLVICDFNTIPQYMIPRMMFYAGGSLDLATQQSAMWTDCDTSDAGDAIVLMRAVKDVMYALVNSNAMNAEVIGYNPPIWQEYLHWINIGAFTLVGVWLVLAIVRTVRCNKRQKAKFAAANAAK